MQDSTWVEHSPCWRAAGTWSGQPHPTEGAQRERRRPCGRTCLGCARLAQQCARTARTIPALPHSTRNEDRRRGGVLQLWVTQDQFLGVCDQVVPRRV